MRCNIFSYFNRSSNYFLFSAFCIFCVFRCLYFLVLFFLPFILYLKLAEKIAKRSSFVYSF